MSDTLIKSPCRICGVALGDIHVSLGDLPALNSYSLCKNISKKRRYDLACCCACGLLQQLYSISVEFIRPKLSWISYNEPVSHLDKIIELMSDDLIIMKNALGVGPFDFPFLSKLESMGIDSTYIDLMKADGLGGYPYLETIQSKLNYESLKLEIGDDVTFDIISCRYLLEHCDKPLDSILSLVAFLKEDGLMIIEVPDSSKFINSYDYAFLWEEHVSYFVMETLIRLVHKADLNLYAYYKIDGHLEDAIVLVIKKSKKIQNIFSNISATSVTNNTLSAAKSYINSYYAIKENYRKELSLLKIAHKSLAMIGTGHHGLMFVNSFELFDIIDFYVDDNLNKLGLYPPGCESKIVSSQFLIDQVVDLGACLLAVNPLVQKSVLMKLEVLKRRGVSFYSIFPERNTCLRLEKVA